MTALSELAPTETPQAHAIQRATHAELLREVSHDDAPHVPRPPVDAIVVPAHRSAGHLSRVARLAAEVGAPLVVLASHDCHVDEVERIVAGESGCRALIADVPSGYVHPVLDFRTSEPRFTELSAGRCSDLSLKRNLGLLLARLIGWRKIMFLDDDIFGVGAAHLARVSAQLERYQVAGLICEDFPDNSVVCHAHRLSGHEQGNFITGGALGVNTADLPLDFFVQIYNEDWFFLARRAATGGVSMVGKSRQEEFNPYERSERAAEEEFGDLLAEGLFAAIEPHTGVPAPTAGYWRTFIESRQTLIDRIDVDLGDLGTEHGEQARESLRHAKKQLAAITPDDCVDFVDAWLLDREDFATRSARISTVIDHAAAFDFLGLHRWLGIGVTDSRRKGSLATAISIAFGRAPTALQICR
jgi:hypothetical protein